MLCIPSPAVDALSFRYRRPTKAPLPPGTHRLTGSGDAVLYVPPSLPAWPAPLVVMFHDSGSDPVRALRLLRAEADRRKALLLAPLLAPRLRGGSSGGAHGLPHAGALALGRGLAATFDRFLVDRDRIVVAGFAGGASYALGLGLANGDFFTRVLAFSPDVIPCGIRSGFPLFFISHGSEDAVLPARRSSRLIAAALEDDGYSVTYCEFDGGHEVPPHVVSAAAGFWD